MTAAKHTLEQESTTKDSRTFRPLTRLKTVRSLEFPRSEGTLSSPILPPSCKVSSLLPSRAYEKRVLERTAAEIDRGECAYYWDLVKLRSQKGAHWWTLGDYLSKQLRNLTFEADIDAVLAVVNG